MTILIPGDLFGLHDEPFERDRGFESSSLRGESAANLT
jgi:hypothetical protein